MVKAYLKGEDREWGQNLGCLTAAYRATVHESTGVTPNLLMLGREVCLPAEIIFGSSTPLGNEISNYGDYVNHLRTKMQKTYEVARAHLKSAARRQKQNYDAKTSFHNYSVGDRVWFLTDMGQLNVTPKLRCLYEGPYLVVIKHNDLNYTIQLDGSGRKKLIHHNRLKPYGRDSEPRWMKRVMKGIVTRQ